MHANRRVRRSVFLASLEVAAILTDLKLDDATIVAALLHDTIEDTEATRAEIDHVFGTRSRPGGGSHKLKRWSWVSRGGKQAENCASCCWRSPTTSAFPDQACRPPCTTCVRWNS